MKHTHYFSFANTAYKCFSTLGIKTICLLSVITFSYNLSAQETTWNGSLDSDWGSSSNWSNGVPDADDFAIIVSSNNDPIIENDNIVNLSHLRIEEGATLTIGENEVVNIKRFDDYNINSRISNIGIRPTATLINYGQINIEGNPDHETEYGIWNNGGTIINNKPSGNLPNSGVIDIVGRSVLDNAIENVGTFTNEGIIMLKGYSQTGIELTEEAVFSNSVNSISIQGGWFGILTNDDASFLNDGEITIKNTIFNGIRNLGQSNFT
ncbi:MAG: hypothetical protein AAGG68_28710, partial [Bacteroidota bacterium]